MALVLFSPGDANVMLQDKTKMNLQRGFSAWRGLVEGED